MFCAGRSCRLCRLGVGGVNLRNITRGLSRFESVVLVFDRLKNRGIEVPGSEDIAAWVDTLG